MSQMHCKFNFSRGSVKFARAGIPSEKALRNAHAFEFLGLLCLKHLEGAHSAVTLSDLNALLDALRSASSSNKGMKAPGKGKKVAFALKRKTKTVHQVQATQVNRLVSALVTQYHLPIEDSSKPFAGPWRFAQDTQIDVLVENQPAGFQILRRALGYKDRNLLWDESLPATRPDVDVIEALATQVVTVQVMHGQAPANTPGNRPREVDPDFWPEEEIVTLLSVILGKSGLREQSGAILENDRAFVRQVVIDRRQERLGKVLQEQEKTWQFYDAASQDAMDNARSATSRIAEPSLRLAALCNEMRALRRAGDIEGALLRMDNIESHLGESRSDDLNNFVRYSVQIERAWIKYLSADKEADYLECEALLIQFSESTGADKNDSRLSLEFHLLAALCARRRAFLQDVEREQRQNWVKHSFRHFNAALRLCLLSEDRELQVHTISTMGDSLWDFGSSRLIRLSDQDGDFHNRKHLAITSLRIVGAGMRLARLGGANSGQLYAAAYILRIIGKSEVTDNDFASNGFKFLGTPVTMKRIFKIAHETMEIPGLSSEAHARIGYGLALVESRCGSLERAQDIVSALLDRKRYSVRLRNRIERLQITLKQKDEQPIAK